MINSRGPGLNKGPRKFLFQLLLSVATLSTASLISWQPLIFKGYLETFITIDSMAQGLGPYMLSFYVKNTWI